VLGVSGEKKTTQENVQGWIQLAKGDPGFQILTEVEIAAVILLLFIFIRTTYIIKFSIYFSKIFA
jgi:hypothetical protein